MAAQAGINLDQFQQLNGLQLLGNPLPSLADVAQITLNSTLLFDVDLKLGVNTAIGGPLDSVFHRIGGNTTPSASILGTKNNNNLEIITNNVTRAVFNALGLNLSIPITAPAAAYSTGGMGPLHRNVTTGLFETLSPSNLATYIGALTSIPTLQQVTTAGNTTTDSIILNNIDTYIGNSAYGTFTPRWSGVSDAVKFENAKNGGFRFVTPGNPAPGYTAIGNNGGLVINKPNGGSTSDIHLRLQSSAINNDVRADFNIVSTDGNAVRLTVGNGLAWGTLILQPPNSAGYVKIGGGDGTTNGAGGLTFNSPSYPYSGNFTVLPTGIHPTVNKLVTMTAPQMNAYLGDWLIAGNTLTAAGILGSTAGNFDITMQRAGVTQMTMGPSGVQSSTPFAIGATAANAAISLYNTRNMVGTNAYAQYTTAQVQSGVTNAYYNRIQTNTAANVADLVAFSVAQGTLTGTVNRNFGFRVDNMTVGTSLIAAFSSAVAAGTNTYQLHMAGTAASHLGGKLWMNILSGGTTNFYNNLAMTGDVTVISNSTTSTILSDVTTSAYINRTSPSTQAAAFVLPTLAHYAASQGTIGAGSSITNQMGFLAQNSLAGATNNYGFYGDVNSPGWNFYGASNGKNRFTGNSGFGADPDVTEKVKITGNMILTGLPSYTTGSFVPPVRNTTTNRIEQATNAQFKSWLAIAFDDLTDVVITTPANNQIVQFNGTNWVNVNPPFLTTETDPVWTAASVNYYTKTNLQTSGAALVHWNNLTNLPTFNLNFLSDVTISSVANNQILKYNSTTVQWENVNASTIIPTPSLNDVATVGNTTTQQIRADGLVSSNSVFDNATPHGIFIQGQLTMPNISTASLTPTRYVAMNDGDSTVRTRTLSQVRQDIQVEDFEVITLSLWNCQPNRKYLTKSASPGVVTKYQLPATTAVGDTYMILGYSNGGWELHHNEGQRIFSPTASTTLSTGAILSTTRYDTVKVTCLEANTFFVVDFQSGTPSFV